MTLYPSPISNNSRRRREKNRAYGAVFDNLPSIFVQETKKIAPAALNNPKFVPEHKIDEQNFYRIREGTKKDTWERLQLMEVRGPGSSSGVVGTRL